MPKTKKRNDECESVLGTAAIIMMLFVASFLINQFGCYRESVHFIPQNEIGEIDYYGEIPYGEIPPDVMVRIKDKKTECVSKGFVYRYWEMKEKLIELGEYEWD